MHIAGGLEIALPDAGDVEWLVADVSLARAFFEGVPAARLLARTRIASDERDLAVSPLGSTAVVSRWEALMTRLLGKAGAYDRVKRQIARQSRAASDEGPLDAGPAVVAALARATAAAPEMDASLAEIVADDVPRVPEGMDPPSLRTCGLYDPRLSRPGANVRVPVFEACVRLATRAMSAPMRLDRLVQSHQAVFDSELKVPLVRPSNIALYPDGGDPAIAGEGRRMVLLERGELDALLTRDPRSLAAAVARIEDGSPLSAARASREGRGLDSLLADLGKLLAHVGDLILSSPLPEAPPDDEIAAVSQGSLPPPSWMPTTWSQPAAGASIADAFERGSMTLPRLRAVTARGGEAALDSLGAEMLRAEGHPFASAAFAELLARAGRSRDIVRLVTYFAVAPDPELAARALAACASPELPGVLYSWLEAMLPTDGGSVTPGRDPQTSSAARLTACVASLAPYPHLYRAVRPLLERVSALPPEPRVAS